MELEKHNIIGTLTNDKGTEIRIPIITLLCMVVNGSITTFLAIFACGCTYAKG